MMDRRTEFERFILDIYIYMSNFLFKFISNGLNSENKTCDAFVKMLHHFVSMFCSQSTFCVSLHNHLKHSFIRLSSKCIGEQTGEKEQKQGSSSGSGNKC